MLRLEKLERRYAIVGVRSRHWRKVIGERYSVAEVARSLRIGLLCAHEDPNRRPTMADIVHELNSYSVTLELPQQPAFCSGRTGRLESNKSTGRSIIGTEFG